LKFEKVLVTGATGFVGRILVKTLTENGIKVKACIRNPNDAKVFKYIEGADPVIVDILDKNSLCHAMEGLDAVYHFAALVDSRASRDDLFNVNVEGTKNVWECAAEHAVKKALYCSSTAVYGLLVRSQQPVSEKVTPKAIEPYGRSKYLGECKAIEIGEKFDISTLIIRPVAVFGPGQHTPFGRNLQNAAFSKILLAGGFENKQFNFVHVEDLVEASIHLMNSPDSNGHIFNIAVDKAIYFEEAFEAYNLALKRVERPSLRLKFFAGISGILQRNPKLTDWISRNGGRRLVFNIWQPGFDITYSSKKLLSTPFQFKWGKFEDVLFSCIK
jgi:nucleoside-diphosphate-sugar epimerase